MRSGVSLADLRREFTCKTDILRAFQAEIDAEVLAKSKPATPEQSPRDRVFDMVMTRFEAMTPYKPALRRISAALCCHPAEAAQLIPSSLAAQYWMLAGAGAKLDGPGAGLRVAGSLRSTARCSASGSTTIRQGSIAPWRRSTAGSRTARSGWQGPSRRAKVSAASPADSCRAAGSAAKEARPRPAAGGASANPAGA